MANLILKASSGNSLVVQGGDASPAITVGNTGTTTFAEAATMSGTLGVTGNTTLSGTANVYGQGTFPAGHIVQTVIPTPTTTMTSFGSGSGTYVLMTAMVASITPRYNNSIIIMTFQGGGMINGAADGVGVKITGTANAVVQEQQYYGYKGNTGWTPIPFAVTARDIPGTLATQTYQLYLRTELNNTGTNARFNGAASGNTASGTTILMEIKV